MDGWDEVMFRLAMNSQQRSLKGNPKITNPKGFLGNWICKSEIKWLMLTDEDEEKE